MNLRVIAMLVAPEAELVLMMLSVLPIHQVPDKGGRRSWIRKGNELNSGGHCNKGMFATPKVLWET